MRNDACSTERRVDESPSTGSLAEKAQNHRAPESGRSGGSQAMSERAVKKAASLKEMRDA